MMEVPEVRFMNRRELAKRWDMSPRTLENWAVQGRGPTPRRFGKRVLYRVSDVEAFEQSVFEGVA
ncbi:Uncharacterised protein [Mycobacteroides abscessus subsp. abscessus]|nr:Uncharacterised protein [Mycobacteroides abscessus subsp. abscessus]